MARPLRIEYPGAWYHVMNRGRRKEPIFLQDKDYKLFLEILKQTIKLFGIEVHSYALMPNHYHLLIRTPLGNLSRSMRHINGVYTQCFNKRHKIDGSLFRGRYKSIVVEEENYLLELVRYIHRNPLKGKLEKHLGEYKWCSHKGYLKDQFKEEWLIIKYVLRKFSKYEKEAKGEMKVFVEKEVPKEILKRLEGLNWPAVLGGKEFKEKIKEHIKGKEIEISEIPEYKRDMIDKTIKEEKIKVILKKGENILNNKGTRKHSLERRAMIYVLRKELNMTLNEIAQYTGGIKYTAISNQYKKANEEVEKKEGCWEKVKEMINKELK